MWRARGQTTALPTNVVSTTQLTALIPAALMSDAVSAEIGVQTGDPMSNPPPPPSNTAGFTVTRPPPKGGGQ